MDLDIKAKVQELVQKITGDVATQKQFKENPVKTVEQLIGVDLPEDQLNKVVDGVKTALTADKAAGVVNKLKGLF